MNKGDIVRHKRTQELGICRTGRTPVGMICVEVQRANGNNPKVWKHFADLDIIEFADGRPNLALVKKHPQPDLDDAKFLEEYYGIQDEPRGGFLVANPFENWARRAAQHPEPQPFFDEEEADDELFAIRA